jgi:hypothetical protein
MQIEALELVSNFVVKSGLRSPKVLSRSETLVDIATFGAAWRSSSAGTPRHPGRWPAGVTYGIFANV